MSLPRLPLRRSTSTASERLGQDGAHLQQQLLQVSDGLLTFLEIEGIEPTKTLSLPEWLLALGVYRRGQAALLSIGFQILEAPPYTKTQRSRPL